MTQFYVDQNGNLYHGDMMEGDRLATQEEMDARETAIAASLKTKFVTMRQARLALLSRGLLDDVTTAINTLPSPQKEAALIEWEYSAEVHRDKALVQMLAPALGLTEVDLDNLFSTAATL